MNDVFPNLETPEWVNSLPEQFHRSFMGLQLWQWLGLVLLIVIVRIAMIIGNKSAVRVMRMRDKYLPGAVSPETHQAMRRAAGMLLGVLVCYPLTGPLSLPRKIDHGVTLILQAMTILAFVMLVYALWDAFCDQLIERSETSSRAERLLVPLTRKFIRLVIVVFGSMFALRALFEINVAAVIASLGIGGIVVALAGKDSVENIFGSITILFDMPFQIGDWVKIDKIEGTVEEINLRSTRIRTFEDTVINLPNANLIRAAVENVSARRYRRQKFNVRIPYDTPAASVNSFCSDLRAFLAEFEGVQADNTIIDFSEMDDTALSVLVQCRFEVSTQADELEMRHRLFVEIMELRKKHGIPFYPAGIARLPEPNETEKK